MLVSIIRSNNYQDSLRLMRLSDTLTHMQGVERVAVMMGTPMNKDIIRDADLATPDLDDATPADLVVTAEVDGADVGHAVIEAVDGFLSRPMLGSNNAALPTVHSLERALEILDDANLALISIPGEYAVAEAHRLLERDINVFLFSDHIDVHDEVELKTHADARGLLVMGPDCGTAIISGVPLGFANAINSGNIGLIGASGTGVQEVMVHIDRLRGGISHAIGLGGRDLSAAIGGISCLQALRALDADPHTDVIVLVGKPPDHEVRDRVLGVAARLAKPVVSVFVGELREADQEGNLHYATTLDDAARLAVELAGTRGIAATVPTPDQRSIRALYTGGTFAAEAAALIIDALDLQSTTADKDGYLHRIGDHEVVDFGDDVYTYGRPHPMLDPSIRNDQVVAAIADPNTAAVVVDVVLGYGSHPDPAGALASVLTDALADARSAGRRIAVIASVCGTERDPQVLSDQILTLERAGVTVMPSNASAVRHALNVLHRRPASAEQHQPVGESIAGLLAKPPRVINIGLRAFADAFVERDQRVVQYDWRPVAGGDHHLQSLLDALQ